MKNTLKHFEKLSQIPHCSFDTKELKDFLVSFARDKGFEVAVDKAFNIHCFKGSPKLCLQSHYDMVCMGEAPRIELLEENGFLKAKNSSLGADNGMGVAIMMSMMDSFDDLECLFTNDEEVGLLGANALEHKIIAPLLLNLDHEVENELVIGCAGGVDIKASLGKKEPKMHRGFLYELSACNFKGGHSGIDIIENIPNSIKEMALFIAQNEGLIAEFEGGERINSIAKHAKAKVFFVTPPKETHFIKVKALGEQEAKIYANHALLLNAINAFSQGVRSFNKKLNMVQTSINLSLLHHNENEFILEFFARSNDEKELKDLEFQTQVLLESFDFKVQSSNFYSPWQGQENEFTHLVEKILKQELENVKVLAVHAGLECGVIQKKQKLSCASIGPNIFNPHSVDERCELASVEKIEKVVEKIILAL